MVSLFELFHSKLELFRLEQRYTRRRNKRTTFTSEAQYVDGEYIYSPRSSKFNRDAGSDSEDEQERVPPAKVNRRKSIIPWGKKDGRPTERRPRVEVREVRWEERAVRG